MSLILPSELLHAVTSRDGRISLVIGAGCSLEAPTNLHLSSYYAEDVHRKLIADNLLFIGDCLDPSDLSAVATAAKARHSKQSDVVSRLPHNEFRMAQPNSGYLIAAALIREGAISTILTLNFDLALTTALGNVSAFEVNVIEGPHATNRLGTMAIIYLHRNVDEPDMEKWVLTTEALEQEWQDDWQEVVAQRVISSPVVVFAGLGSPASVLTASVGRVRSALQEGQHKVFVVDPALSTAFESTLDLPESAHLQAEWSPFMEEMAERLILEFRSELEEAGRALCDDNTWAGESEYLGSLCERLHKLGLVSLGSLRAKWLLHEELYTRHDAGKSLIVDLLLGLGLMERATGTQLHFRSDGIVELSRDGGAPTLIFPASGGGTMRWSALEAKVLDKVRSLPSMNRPKYVLAGGVIGTPPTAVAPPENLIMGEGSEDIVNGFQGPTIFQIDEIRANTTMITNLVA